MAEFSIELRARIAQVRLDLDSARSHGEDSLADAWAGELESLERIARDHHVDLDDHHVDLEGRQVDLEPEVPLPAS